MQVVFAPSFLCVWNQMPWKNLWMVVLPWNFFLYFLDDLNDCQNLWSYRTISPNVILIFPKNFLDFKVDMIEKQGIICGAFNKFPDFFIQAFKIVEDSWKFPMLLLYILRDDWPIFMISDEQLQQELEYTLLKTDCHSWWISKMQSGCEDTLEERYAIKFCFKLGTKCHRNIWNASDCFWSILHESSISFRVA